MLNVATIGIFLASGIVASLNPVSIGLLIMVMSSIYGKGHNNARLFKYGFSYALGILISTLAFAVLSWAVIAILPIAPRAYIAIGLAIVLVIVGLIEVKDYFWYGKKFSVHPPKKALHYLHDLALKMKNSPEYFMLGALSGVVLLPYTGLVLLTISMIVSLSYPFSALGALLLYSLASIFTVVFLIFSILGGVKLSVITKWKEDSKATMRLTSGLLFIFLGWTITLIASGIVRLG
jgi:cytochrome c biogenesis protein CcdA